MKANIVHESKSSELGPFYTILKFMRKSSLDRQEAKIIGNRLSKHPKKGKLRVKAIQHSSSMKKKEEYNLRGDEKGEEWERVISFQGHEDCTFGSGLGVACQISSWKTLG